VEPTPGHWHPGVGNYSTRVFFPFQVLLDLSPVGLWDFFFLLRLWIAGIFTALFLTRAGTSRTAAVFGGIAYMLSGALVWFINLEQYANVAMVVPIWFLAVERFVINPGGRRSAWIALAVALMLLAGQPEIAFYALVSGGLYGIVRGCVHRRPRRPSVGPSRGVLWAWCWAFAIAAAQLLPSRRISPMPCISTQAGGHGDTRSGSGVPCIQIFVPSFYELPTALRIRLTTGRGPPWRLCGSADCVPLRGGSPSSALARPATDAGTIDLLQCRHGLAAPQELRGAPLRLDRLPSALRQSLDTSMGGPTWCFALAVASAFGLQRLIETDLTRVTRARLAIVAAGVLLLVGVLGGIGFEALAPLQSTHWSFIWPGALAGLLLAFVMVGLAAVAIGRCSGLRSPSCFWPCYSSSGGFRSPADTAPSSRR